ncbi:MAG: DUF4114 domain-containing protein [Leeuwenhoekiella sp.]
MKRILHLISSLLFTTLLSAQNYNYLGTFDALGVPDYLVESDAVSEETIQMINAALPENYPVPTYNPQYISSGYDTNVILDETAQVWVTFVKEGAGYKNVLGYYTYDVNNPDRKYPMPEDITIIFPNVSGVGSGGGLRKGNKVSIGTFPAGTGIGWVLLANGYQNGAVTAGQWQLFSDTTFNPEADEDLRHHNVLLNDADNERIILGFEDIRRDFGSCDNDFNDALFYITANPYSAIRVNNFNDITEHAAITSGNEGGLESNGDLATAIAKQMFTRAKTNSSSNEKSKQTGLALYKSNNEGKNTLSDYLPETGMFGTEKAYVSSPTDLIAITNATNVASVDYYHEEERLAAALVTETENKVYSHTKAICDRLNDSQLLDVRTINLQGYTLVYSKIQRHAGVIEYAVTFSVKEEANSHNLYSFWNLDEYPEGAYLNYQVWGSSMGQVSTIVNHILNTLKEEKTLVAGKAVQEIPTVFVKKGFYEQGKLHLTVINKTNQSQLGFTGNYKATEYSQSETIIKTIPLSGAWEERVIVETGFLFDIGISISTAYNDQYDSVYLADGPWGMDYDNTVDVVNSFEVISHQPNQDIEGYLVERGIKMNGEIKQTVNVFRNLLAGNLFLPVADLEYLSFQIKNDLPVEVSLMTNTTANWEDRLKVKLDKSADIKTVSLAFTDFENASGAFVPFTEIKSVVFSIAGDYVSSHSFEIAVSQLAFTETPNSLGSEDFIATTTISELKNYPNPVANSTTIILPFEAGQIDVAVININGQVVLQESINTIDGNKATLDASKLSPGIYMYSVFDTKTSKTYSAKLMKN